MSAHAPTPAGVAPVAGHRTRYAWPPRARILALTLWVAILGLSVAELWMILITLDRAPLQWGIRGYEAGLAMAFGSVGALIAVKRPRNPLGWFGLAVSVVIAVQGLTVQYPVLAATQDPPLAGAEVARWFSSWIWVLSAGTFLTLFPLYFPDGRLLSPRWRAAAFLGLAAMSIQIGLTIASSQPFGPVPPSNSPEPYFDIIGPRMVVGYALLWISGGVSASSLVIRYRRARGEERQQIKWVAYAIVLVALGAVVGMTPLFLGQLVFLGTSFFGAVAMAIAVLRYRLYEIDLIINRTLVYGALSAVLAGIYTASITLSQKLFVAVTGDRSDLPIVLTTLIVVSLFTPLKNRLQKIVDSRIQAASPDAAAQAQSPVAGSPAETLQMLAGIAELRAAGALTPLEFRRKKADLLSRL